MSNPLTTWVRVRDQRTGAHLTVTEARASRHAQHYDVLKAEKATDVNGRPLPPIYPQPVEKKAADKTKEVTK